MKNYLQRRLFMVKYFLLCRWLHLHKSVVLVSASALGLVPWENYVRACNAKVLVIRSLPGFRECNNKEIQNWIGNLRGRRNACVGFWYSNELMSGTMIGHNCVATEFVRVKVMGMSIKNKKLAQSIHRLDELFQDLDVAILNTVVPVSLHASITSWSVQRSLQFFCFFNSRASEKSWLFDEQKWSLKKTSFALAKNVCDDTKSVAPWEFDWKEDQWLENNSLLGWALKRPTNDYISKA